MEIASAKSILIQIEKTALTHLLEELLGCAIRYGGIRTAWYISDLNDRRELEQSRTMAHNVLIDACNILSRNMLKNGEDNAWRAKLGNDRKVIGDFACFVHCILGLRSR
jgi:hypothetical protein